MHTAFTELDLVRGNHITTENFRRELYESRPDWMQRGLQETASGYGMKLNSGYKIDYCGRLYRVYVTQISNAGSAWFTVKGVRIYVS